ncbi:MAG: hypothetical protein WA840_11245 [Caulobacteraceae bacterium]
MIAQSERATSARESAYRIAAPNSTPRAIMLVALEAGAARLLADIAKDGWRRTTFRSSVWLEDAPDPRGEALDQWCDIVAGHAENLVNEIAASDLVVMVTTAGDPATGASVIGEACVARGVKTSGIILQTPQTSSDALSSSLRELRPWTRTLSVFSDAGMVPDMIHALGG